MLFTTPKAQPLQTSQLLGFLQALGLMRINGQPEQSIRPAFSTLLQMKLEEKANETLAVEPAPITRPTIFCFYTDPV